MTAVEFDNYDRNYEAVVERSIAFSGLKHDFFMAAKADLLRGLADRHFGDSETVDLLDVGCGVGRLHRHIAGSFRSISGVDVSAASIARATEDNPFAGYAAYDGARIPYADGAFGLVTAICVMHHVPPTDWPAFAAELRRVTRPGGLAVVIEHNPFNPLTRLAVARCPFDADAVLLRAGRTGRLLREAGFVQVSARHFLLLPFGGSAARGVESVVSRLPLGAQYAAIARG